MLLQENAQKLLSLLEALIDAEILRSNHEDREARFEFRHALLLTRRLRIDGAIGATCDPRQNRQKTAA